MESNVPFIVGSYVRIKEQGMIGKVVRLHRSRLVISINQLLLYVPLKAIEKVDRLPNSPIQKKITKPINFEGVQSSNGQDTTLDLHGLNKAQALLALDKFIDHSLLLGHHQLKIIHGQGGGILRSAVRNYLQDHGLVKRVIIQSPIYHMAGITIVEL